MNYYDGKKVLVGDQLKLFEGCEGTVVCSVEDDEYTSEYPRDHWGYLGKGVMIMTNFGLFHYPDADEDMELIAREPLA